VLRTSEHQLHYKHANQNGGATLLGTYYIVSGLAQKGRCHAAVCGVSIFIGGIDLYFQRKYVPLRSLLRNKKIKIKHLKQI
jgi:hypothetical protein